MLTPLAVLTAALATALALWSAVRLLRKQPVTWHQAVASGVVEVSLLVQAVIAVVLAATGPRLADGPSFWGYLVTTLLVLPVAVAWSFAERTRWSSVVLLVAAVMVALLQVRLVEVWHG